MKQEKDRQTECMPTAAERTNEDCSSWEVSADPGSTNPVKQVWHLLVRNRVAIAIASLLWLIFRSGSKPQRLTYPCQQVAAANVGVFVAGLFPVLFLAKKRKNGQALPLAVVLRRQVAIAGIMFAVAMVGVESYQYADDYFATTAVYPNVPPPANEPPPATVAVVQQTRNNSLLYTQTAIEDMVAEAVELAGGMENLMVDKDSDGIIEIVLKPNLVTDISLAAYPENGVTTHPYVMAGALKAVHQAAENAGFDNANISLTIAEGTASGWPWVGGYLGRDITRLAYKACGYTNDTYAPQYLKPELAPDADQIPLVDLNDSGGLDQFDPNKVTEVTIDNYVCRNKYWIPNVLLEADVFISVPIFKNHVNADVTLALKNSIGIAPSDIYHAQGSYEYGHGKQMKLALHMNNPFPWNTVDRNPSLDYPAFTTDENAMVNYTIVDLNLCRPYDFAIVDGMVGITNGPTGRGGDFPSTPDKNTMQLVMAGADSVALDTVGTLMMGYDPEYVSYLRWAYNREMGTMNPANITVVGDHVAWTRQEWTLDQPNSERADVDESHWPSIQTITVDDPSVSTASVTGSGLNYDSGLQNPVVRADVEIHKVQQTPVNLLTNGDFEAGFLDPLGWEMWSASWGSDESWLFTSPAPAGHGSQCLKLGNAQTTGSFGVYQTVSVTPGKTYRLEAYWKGTRLSAGMNWFEILLLDGPWDQTYADGADPKIVESNYLYAYDENTYGPSDAGLDVGDSFGWMWTEDHNAPPALQVDWNNRRGERTATGNEMTVVLKCGATNGAGVEAYFDSISLVEVGERQTVASVANPSDPFTAQWDSTAFEDGFYEVIVTVYDKYMNESHKKQVVEIANNSIYPVIQLDPQTIDHTITTTGTLANDMFTVANVGVNTLDYTIDVQYEPAGDDWLSLSSYSGAVTTTPDSIDIIYDTPELAPGLYEATITVSSTTASNSPKSIAVSLEVTTVKPDFDGDGDVDQADFGALQACFTGSIQVTEPCLAADLNGDTYVNNFDLPLLEACMEGAGIVPDQTCDD